MGQKGPGAWGRWSRLGDGERGLHGDQDRSGGRWLGGAESKLEGEGRGLGDAEGELRERVKEGVHWLGCRVVLCGRRYEYISCLSRSLVVLSAQDYSVCTFRTHFLNFIIEY